MGENLQPHHEVLGLEKFSREPEKDSNTFKLPSGIGELLVHYPKIRPLLAEFSLTDKVTFVHSLLVQTFALKMADLYAQSVELPYYSHLELRKILLGNGLHDIGKTMLVPGDPEASAWVVNQDTSENGTNNFSKEWSGDHIDNRSEAERSLHRLHPLLGGLMISEYLKNFGVDAALAQQWAENEFSHHERDKDLVQANIIDARRFPSYPREENRTNGDNPLMEVAKFVTQIADAAVSMGFPRVYRPWKLKDNVVFLVLSQNVIREPRLRQIFGELDERKMLEAERFFLTSTFSVLKALQDKYRDNEAILNPGIMRLDGVPITESGDERLDQLAQLSSKVWKEHYERIESEIGK